MLPKIIKFPNAAGIGFSRPAPGFCQKESVYRFPERRPCRSWNGSKRQTGPILRLTDLSLKAFNEIYKNASDLRVNLVVGKLIPACLIISNNSSSRPAMRAD